MRNRHSIVTDYWLAGWVCGVIAVSVASIIPDFTPSRAFDKELHFLSYCLLTIIPLARVTGREVAFLLACFMPVLGFLLEYIQRNITGREFSPEDMIANNLGAIAGFFIGILLRLNRRFHKIEGRRT